MGFTVSALLVFLLFGLSLMVSLTRLRLDRGYGNEPDPSQWLTKVVRAQGNAIEYIPILVILMITLDIEGTRNWADYVYMTVCFARYSHAAGMLMSPSLDKGHPLRFIGSVLTYVCGFTLGALLIF